MHSRSTAPSGADTTTDATDDVVSRGTAATTHAGRRAAAAVATTVGAAAVVTGAFAAPADAATHHHHTVWDRVANCESSRSWHIDNGNGYYGGLQFSSSTWHSFHGTKYAHHADNATRKEQIQVGRRVLAAEGPDAWPVCSRHADLTKHNGHATHAALPHHVTTTSYEAKHRSGSQHHGSQHDGSHHKHHHGAHHKHHHGSHHGTVGHGHYRVRSGDTLSSIAHRKDVHGGWHALYRANKSHLSSPDRLHVGQVLALP